MEMNYDEATLRQIEEELDTKIYPGTEIMTDVGSHRFVKSSPGSDRVLVPQPSNNPHDPLNWDRYWKMSAMSVATVVTFAQGFGPLALAPMFPQLIQDFNSDLAGVVQFAGVCILVLGFSNFFWVPTAQPQIIADIVFLHERGAYNTLYFTVYFATLIISPIIAGPMTEHLHWRQFWWLNTAILALALLMSIFMFPETRWHRQHPKPSVSVETADNGLQTDVDTIKPNPEAEHISDEEQAAEDPYLGKGKPAKQQFKLFQVNETPFQSMFKDFWVPWKLHLFPIIHLASFIVSWSASVFLAVNLTQSQNFAAPPYNFSPQTVGFLNFAILVGVMIGLATNGALSDWVSMLATKKNRGIREPEMRLPAMIPYTILMIIGSLVVAFGYEYKWDWKIIVIIGFTAVGMQVAALPAIASTYAVDSYKPVAGSIFVTITVNKNLWGYGLSKFITPWTEKDGFIPAYMLIMALTTLFCASGIIFYYYGKRLRKITAKSSVHNMGVD
ncbi:hypothetical protein FQN51_000544 [Onygenales sp. PD_10]|nr:hypothetical protein FQN51_000544 [Onygenales sp. PD_10]